MADIPYESEQLIEEALNSVRLPPRAVRELLEISQQSDVEIQHIADTITSDETLTARVLRLVNSALFSLPHPVSSVQQAVVLLGKESIIQLAVGVAAMTLEASIVDDTSFSREDFWRHSMAVAYLARELGNHRSEIGAEEAFTAGLLHDIGKLVLLSYLGNTYSRIVDASHVQQRPLHLAEREALGTDHGIISRKLCEKWKLPPSLLDGVSTHDAGADAPGRLRAIVRVGDAVAKSAGVGDSGNRYISLNDLDETLLRLLAQQPVLIRRLPDEVSRIERAFRFEADGSTDADEETAVPSARLFVQFDDAVLGHVFAILSSTLGVEPVRLHSGESPTDAADVTGWVTDATPGNAPDGIPVIDAGTWLADHAPYADDNLDVVALRTWLTEHIG